MITTPKPLVLMILDGFGHSDNPESNAIFAAKKPVLDRLWATVPNGLISGSGMDVGLPVSSTMMVFDFIILAAQAGWNWLPSSGVRSAAARALKKSC